MNLSLFLNLKGGGNGGTIGSLKNNINNPVYFEQLKKGFDIVQKKMNELSEINMDESEIQEFEKKSKEIESDVKLYLENTKVKLKIKSLIIQIKNKLYTHTINKKNE
jgi:hypothetical protein